ncbi:MAG: hypothetical protein IJV27_06670 [Prevotella sp.]|nr:hypothetical protein [Prevotella sp.]
MNKTIFKIIFAFILLGTPYCVNAQTNNMGTTIVEYLTGKISKEQFKNALVKAGCPEYDIPTIIEGVEQHKDEFLSPPSDNSTETSDKATVPTLDGKIHIYYFNDKSFVFSKEDGFATVNQVAQRVTEDTRRLKKGDAYYYKGQTQGFYDKEPKYNESASLFFLEPEIWIYLSSNGKVSHIVQNITCTANSQETVDTTLRKIHSFIMNRTENGVNKPRTDVDGGYENEREYFEVNYGGTYSIVQNNDGKYVGVLTLCEKIK